MSTAKLSISVCISTHERAFLLGPTLDAISRQTRLPDEIIISDSSSSSTSEDVVRAFELTLPDLFVKYVKTEQKALPWHRWNGFQHSKGEIVFLMDDDITLVPNALEMLENAYADLDQEYGQKQVAGIGFYTFLDDGTEKVRRPNSFEERWLGISRCASSSITRGGISVPPKGMSKDTIVQVGRLSGGSMSYRRQVLEQVGCLNNLIDLYNLRIGAGEDAVLSYHARKYGRLFMLTHCLLLHPNEQKAIHSVKAGNGWQKGLLETWGRAHTMRWMATDIKAYWRDWARVASLEVLRSIWWGILRRPFSPAGWGRFTGSLYGIFLTMFRFGSIPSSARSEN